MLKLEQKLALTDQEKARIRKQENRAKDRSMDRTCFLCSEKLNSMETLVSNQSFAYNFRIMIRYLFIAAHSLERNQTQCYLWSYGKGSFEKYVTHMVLGIKKISCLRIKKEFCFFKTPQKVWL